MKYHPKKKIWTNNPKYIITYSADDSWVKDKHIVKVNARCVTIAIERAKELIDYIDKDAIFISCKKYHKKKSQSALIKRKEYKERIKLSKNLPIDMDLKRFFTSLQMPIFIGNWKKMNFVGVQPLSTSSHLLADKFYFNSTVRINNEI